MEIQTIQNKIYEIRGQRVMLDFDLAALYQVETKRLKEAIRRNIERFEGDEFMFELTEREYTDLRPQFASSSWGGRRYLPFAFPELGVAILSSVLRNNTVSIRVRSTTLPRRIGSQATIRRGTGRGTNKCHNIPNIIQKSDNSEYRNYR